MKSPYEIVRDAVVSKCPDILDRVCASCGEDCAFPPGGHRPVYLHDVLRAIDKEYKGDKFATVASNGWVHFGSKRAFWNLSQPLEAQSPELLAFLAGILV